MNCEHCKYCHGGQLPESYDEEWVCEKGFADPMEDEGCVRFWMFITEPFRGLYRRIKYRKILSGFKESEEC